MTLDPSVIINYLSDIVTRQDQFIKQQQEIIAMLKANTITVSSDAWENAATTDQTIKADTEDWHRGPKSVRQGP